MAVAVAALLATANVAPPPPPAAAAADAQRCVKNCGISQGPRVRFDPMPPHNACGPRTA
jgi:hypothetical protein